MRAVIVIAFAVILSKVDGYEIVQDMFPVAKGNYWKWKDKGNFGRHQWEIVESDNGKGLDLLDKKYRIPLKFYDSLGRINKIPSRITPGQPLPMKSFTWAPQAALLLQKPKSGDWGNSNVSFSYYQNGGHMDRRYSVHVPVIGPVRLYYYRMEVVENVTEYFINKVPQAITDDFKPAPSKSSHFSCSPLNGDTCVVTFRAETGKSGKFYTVSSFNPITQCLRLYLADTGSAAALKATWFEHKIKIVNCERNKKYQLKIYKTTYKYNYRMECSLISESKLMVDRFFPSMTTVVNKEPGNSKSAEISAVYNTLSGGGNISLKNLKSGESVILSLINPLGKVTFWKKVSFHRDMRISLKESSGKVPSYGIYLLRIETDHMAISKPVFIGK